MDKLVKSPVMLSVAGVLAFASLWMRLFDTGYVSNYVNKVRYVEDLQVYALGAEAFFTQDNLYLAPVKLADGQQLPFIYPPIAALLFQPLRLFSPQHAIMVFSLVSVLALYWTAYLVLRQCKVELAWQWALLILPALLWLDPVKNTLHHGQINIMLMALVATDLWYQPAWRRKFLPVGSLIALAATIKLTPAIFGFYFLVQRQWWSAVSTVVSFIVISLVGFLFRPKISLYYFQHEMLGFADKLGLNRAHNLSLRSVVTRFFRPEEQSSVLVLLMAMFVVGGLAVAYRLIRAHANEMSIVALAFVALLGSPISWQHHWVWTVPMLILLILRAVRFHDDLAALFALLWLSISTVFVPHMQIRHQLGTTFDKATFLDVVQTSYVWFAMALLAVMFAAPHRFVLSDARTEKE